ncbi:hypothetical protein PAXINDRAFT_15998 [Paxillus involutus ATCC 200175]|uniref:Uncharacterized protein n=1 Tax=Paxillus involutus ATCC 200175 TaxID=664439 RepID=A0A0C9TTC5_PAXIN|nr:hypothetical protein PAXINDRAFT_15998 [Paxillus involutus ATCC 200175]
MASAQYQRLPTRDHDEHRAAPLDPRFNPLPLPVWKRVALITFIIFLFWLSFTLRQSKNVEPNGVHASRYSKESKSTSGWSSDRVQDEWAPLSLPTSPHAVPQIVVSPLTTFIDLPEVHPNGKKPQDRMQTVTKAKRQTHTMPLVPSARTSLQTKEQVTSHVQHVSSREVKTQLESVGDKFGRTTSKSAQFTVSTEETHSSNEPVMRKTSSRLGYSDCNEETLGSDDRDRFGSFHRQGVALQTSVGIERQSSESDEETTLEWSEAEGREVDVHIAIDLAPLGSNPQIEETASQQLIAVSRTSLSHQIVVPDSIPPASHTEPMRVVLGPIAKKTSSSTSMIDEGTHLSQGTDSGQSQPRMDTLARPTERLRNTNLPPSNATPPHDDKEISSQELSEHESQHPSPVVVLDQTVAESELRVGYAYVEHQADIASHKSMGAVPLSEVSPSFFLKPASPGGSQESQVDLRASGSIAGSSTVYHGSDAYEMGWRHARGRELSTAVDLSSAETISRTLNWGRLPSLPTMLLLAPLLAFRNCSQEVSRLSGLSSESNSDSDSESETHYATESFQLRASSEASCAGTTLSSNNRYSVEFRDNGNSSTIAR